MSERFSLKNAGPSAHQQKQKYKAHADGGQLGRIFCDG
jgi:hypothetical protein